MRRASAVLFGLIASALLAGCAGNSNSAGTGTTLPAAGAQVHDRVATAVSPTQSPPPDNTIFQSTWWNIAPFQVFDYFPKTKTQMTTAQIQADASRYPGVWSSFFPTTWTGANKNIFVSQYYIAMEDSSTISGYTLQWWQQNHPDWILYACTGSGQPTTELAYSPGVGYPDVPLDFSNPDVENYQIRTSLVPYMLSHGYNAVAFDLTALGNQLEGGNPNFGQQVISGYYGCGVYSNGTFVKHWTSRQDPNYAKAMLNYFNTVKSIFTTDPTISQYHFKIFLNHSPPNLDDPNEIALLKDADMIMDESGYSDYGNYNQQGYNTVFNATYNYMEWLQSHNVPAVVINDFDKNQQKITKKELEYVLAAYLMSKEQAEFIYTSPANTPGYGYGAEQWHNEYTTNLSHPCSAMYGGPSYDPNNPHIYYRRYVNGLAVLNSGSLPAASETATLPSGITYTDIEGKKVTNPLTVPASTGFVMTAPTGTGCN